MPEIDKLTAQVDVDTLLADRKLDRTDKKADEVAENRTGVIKLIIDDDDVTDFKKRNKRGGGILGGILGGGDGDAIPVLEVHQLTDALGEATEGLVQMGDAGSGAGKGLLGVSGAAGGATPALIGMGGSAASAAATVGLVVVAVATLLPLLTALGGGVALVVAAFAPLVGLLGILPGLVMGVVGVFTVLAGAFDGIGEALNEQQASLEDVQAKSLALTGAILGLARAKWNLQQATEAAANAERDASEAIEDAQFAATGAQLGQERAVLALEAAYKRLAAVQNPIIDKTMEITKVTDFFTGKQFEVARITYDSVKSQEDLRDATLAVKEAELGLLMAQDRREDTAIALAELQEKGIANSDIMIASQLALAEANLGIANSQLAIADSLKALTGEGSAYKELSDDGKALVDLLGELRPLWEEFKDSMADVILPAAVEALENLKPILEDLDVILSPVAEAIATIFTDLSEELGSDTFIGKLTEFFDNYGDDLATLGPTFGSIAQGIADIALAAEPLQTFLFDKFNEFFGEDGKFREWTSGNSEMGDLTGWFQLTADVLDKTLDIIGNLVVGFTGFVEAAAPAGKEMLDNMVALTEEFAIFTNSAEGQNSIADFFDRIMEPLGALSDLAGAVLKGMVNVFGSKDAMEFLTVLATTLEDDVLPAVLGFFDALFQSGLLDELAKGIGEMFKGLSELERIGVLDQLFGALRIVTFIVRMIFTLINGLTGLIPDNALTFGLDGDILGAMLDVMLDLAEEKIVTFFEGLPETLGALLSGVFDGMFDGLLAEFGSVWDSIANIINDAIDQIPSWTGLRPPHLPTFGEAKENEPSADSLSGMTQQRLEDILAGLPPPSAGIPPGGRPDPWHMEPITQSTQYQFDIDVNGQLDPMEFANWMEWQLSSTPQPPPPQTKSIQFGRDVIPGFRGPQ